ncbi:hypothetical protein AcW1_005077 [Taiwanofungus camphoratus]|nr:hypothetical protein AcW1_005077 [Antrodia cinnamomea]
MTRAAQGRRASECEMGGVSRLSPPWVFVSPGWMEDGVGVPGRRWKEEDWGIKRLTSIMPTLTMLPSRSTFHAVHRR